MIISETTTPPNETSYRKKSKSTPKQNHVQDNANLKGNHGFHRTKDVDYVIQVIGHKKHQKYANLHSTRRGTIHTSTSLFSKVAKTEAEACILIDAEFVFVCDFDGHKLFRKRK